MNIKTKIKKSVFIKTLPVALLALGLAWGGAAVGLKKTAYASMMQTEVFSEDFDGAAFSGEWANPVNTQLQVGENSMRYDGASNWGSCVSPMSHRISKDTDIRFDIELSGDGWLALAFGLPSSTSSVGYADAGTWFFATQTRLMDDRGGTLGGVNAETMDEHETYSFSPFSMGGKVSLHYVLTQNGKTREFDGAKLYDMDLYMYRAGAEEPEQPNVFYRDLELDGYYGFSSMGNVKMTVQNFVVKEGEETVFEDDFTNSGFMFDRENTPGAKWAVTMVDPSALSIGPVADVAVTTGLSDGSLSSIYEITRDSRMERQFTLTLEASLKDISEKTAFGLYLGGGNLFVGLERAEEGKYRAVTAAEGSEPVYSAVASLDSDALSMTFEGYSDGRIVLAVGNASFELQGGEFGGKFKIGTKHLAEGEVAGGKAVFDNVKLRSYAYDGAPAGKDAAINFKGVRTYQEGDETLYEYYVNRNEWLMQGVSSPMYSTVQARNYVQFSDSSWYTLFGPKQQYSEFICRFTVTVTDNDAPNDTAIIFTYARDVATMSATEAPYIVFTKKPHNQMEIAGGAGTTGSAVVNDVSFWNNRDENNALLSYDVMVIVIEGKIEVSVTPHGANENTAVSNTVFTCDNTKGFLAIAGHNSASFRIASFSVNNINIDSIKTQALNLGGKAQTYRDGTLLSNGSFVTTQEEFRDFILYAKIKPLQQGTVDILLPDGRGLSIGKGCAVAKGITDMQKGARYDKLLSGEEGTLYVRVQNGLVTAGYAASNEPIVYITATAVSFRLPVKTERGGITVFVGEGSAVLLESLKVYSLDAKIEIATQDYDPSFDEDIDKVKPEFGEITKTDENKLSDGAIAGIVVGSVLGAGAICAAAIVIVLQIRRKKA